jgi:uncharacterized membrane protein
VKHLRPSTAALLAVLAGTSLAGCATQVAAYKRAAAAKVGATEACYGIARAGKNDCRTQAHVCAGWAYQERDPTAFVYVPAGTCEKIVGGKPGES